MIMLKLHERDNTEKHITVLNNASDVCVSQELNKSYRLSFKYPNDKKGVLITVGRIVDCEGQLFRILRVQHTNDGQNLLNITCDHVFYADGQKVFAESFGMCTVKTGTDGRDIVTAVSDFVNERPSVIADYAVDKIWNEWYGRNSPFTFLKDKSELERIGMESIDLDGDGAVKFTTDFFVKDKVNVVELIESITENCGKGEIYIDNYNIALVERIGRDSGVRLELDRNLESVTVERNITEMITRLYPYGPNDEHIGSVAEGRHYVDSPNIEAYGIMAGYKNYDAIEGADNSVSVAAKLKAMAEWEFAQGNENRIDVPSVSISGRLVDISKLEEYGDVYKVRLGDTVTVIDNGVEIKERVTALETYPYEAKSGSITIGKVQKNLYFYLDQLRHRVNMKGR